MKVRENARFATCPLTGMRTAYWPTAGRTPVQYAIAPAELLVSYFMAAGVSSVGTEGDLCSICLEFCVILGCATAW